MLQVKCGFWKILRNCWSIWNPSLYPRFLPSKLLIFHALCNNSPWTIEISFSGLLSSIFICKNGSRRYKYVVVKNNTAYSLKVTLQIFRGWYYCSNGSIFFINNIYLAFGGHVYQQTVDISMVRIVPHWWQICSYVHLKLLLYNIYKRVSLNVSFMLYLGGIMKETVWQWRPFWISNYLYSILIWKDIYRTIWYSPLDF